MALFKTDLGSPYERKTLENFQLQDNLRGTIQ